MFTTVRGLTEYMDSNIGYVRDAQNHHECSEAEYEAYIERMNGLLHRQIKELQRISTNKSLIAKYERTVSELF